MDYFPNIKDNHLDMVKRIIVKPIERGDK